jgi:hypothetical protein
LKSRRPKTAIEQKPKELLEITGGKLRLNFHCGQWKAWQSERRFIAVLAGTQGGKTSYGPIWLWREMKQCGPGDYLVVTPTFPLLELKALPEFRKFFEILLKLGNYVSSPVRKFTISKAGEIRLFGAPQQKPTHVYFGYAADPESLESATVKAVWCDEAGQKKFKLGSWEAILRRLSLAQGRALITTTPYDLGWLKQKVWDKWKAGDRDIEVVRFESIANPAFPQDEFERARRDLPPWKFDLFYRAIFTRPAGMIYDSFDEARHKIPRLAIPDHWPRYLGLDFGGVNTAAVFYAEELSPANNQPTGRLFAYREYKAGGRTAAEHAYYLLKGEPMIPDCVGGSKSEGQWRQEFRQGGKVKVSDEGGPVREVEAPGLPVRSPDIKDVEVGIDRVYGFHKRNQLFVFDDLHQYLAEKMSYSRELDPNGEPTEKIEDKETFHLMDAERYILGWLSGTGGGRVGHGESLWGKG